jgi:glutamine amidotransferase
MCRLTAYLGIPTLAADLVTRPSRSVIRQSFDARERLGGSGNQVYDRGNLNADGFGLGWYMAHDKETEQFEEEDLRPCVFTEVGPAWHNRNLHRLCQKICSPIIFAHVRAAGPGMGVCHCACHPFEWGRYLFMHNGQVACFGKVRRRLMDSLSDAAYDFCIANSASDSALSFALFIDQLEDPYTPISPQQLQKFLTVVITTLTRALDEAGVVDTSLLNFVVTDGRAMVATRYACNKHPTCTAASLYYASGSSFEASSVAPEPLLEMDKGCSKVDAQTLKTKH